MEQWHELPILIMKEVDQQMLIEWVGLVWLMKLAQSHEIHVDG